MGVGCEGALGDWVDDGCLKKIITLYVCIYCCNKNIYPVCLSCYHCISGLKDDTTIHLVIKSGPKVCFLSAKKSEICHCHCSYLPLEMKYPCCVAYSFLLNNDSCIL